ncbi:MAG TPA: hypothetical protein VM914_05635 [Pyrinomonadaceae bacterium]|jgi:hypothetical protein|nr:hypothetical protein [Pyrinomonadaceae bacterium]
MLRRFTSGLTAAALLCTLLGGAAFARGSGGECRMSGMSGRHACCKRARTKRRAPVVGAARLCCLARLPEQTPANTNFAFKPSADASTSPRPAATAQTPSLRPHAQTRAYSPPFHPSHSPPAYIQHSAFLI